ncbi:hypothetical protein [Owenweeksia hongkongensis]|uniref:hypothetical protein n=1 Tax=Owenweeksia hongkongensis TaxID=253245 RepID=UPI003A8CCF77
MKVQLKIFAILIIPLLISCVDRKKNYEDCHHYMTIINNSDLVLYAIAASSYPDTIGFVDVIPNPLFNEKLTKVNPNSVNTDAVKDIETCMEVHFSKEVAGKRMDTMMVFLFREDSLLANDWKDAPNFVLKRYDLTIDDLNALNWTVTYP